jgi:hypothetical protein
VIAVVLKPFTLNVDKLMTTTTRLSFQELFNDKTRLEPITGSIRTVHQFTDMSNYELEIIGEDGNPETVMI